MTVRELREAVIHLGIAEAFDDSVLDAVFYDAATRALTEVSRLIPRIRRAVITHCPIAPLDEPVSFTHTEDDVIKSAHGVAAFCFYVSNGDGTLKVRWKNETRTIRLNGSARRLYSFIVNSRELFSLDGRSADIELIFSGDYVYRISELTFYSSLRADGTVLPPSAGSSFDMEIIAPDFLRFSAPPVYREDGEPVDFDADYYIEGSRLILPHYAPEGDYCVTYEHKPTPITPDTPDNSFVDCERELCDLLPLVCAYYVWLDDDPDKAGAYYARYTELAAIKMSQRKIKTRMIYRTSNGWD
jgi:hypothetical protein